MEQTSTGQQEKPWKQEFRKSYVSQQIGTKRKGERNQETQGNTQGRHGRGETILAREIKRKEN